jgi:two-component system chemotaxis response regulator CheB
VEALRDLVSHLPPDFPAAVLVVLHVPATGSSALPQILQRAGRLPVRHAQEGDALEPGVVLVAPPDRHLIVFDHAVTLSRGPRENGHRPAVDVLFRTAAATLGRRVIGVVLSGTLDDGSAGMVAVDLRGGVGVVQDPDEALHGSMPRSAALAVPTVHMLPVAKIAGLLAELVEQQLPDSERETEGQQDASPLMTMEAAMADMDRDALINTDRPGNPSGWSCPDCHGALFEIEEGGLTRFRCRVGDAWSPASLLARQSASLESALWMALRALEEKAALTLGLGARARDRGHILSGQQFEQQAAEAHRSADILRRLIAEIGSAESLSDIGTPD